MANTGGTVDGSLGALTFGSANGTLSGVTMNNAFTVPASARFTSTSGTTFTGSTTFSGANTVYLANGTGTDLTIGPGGTWAGQVSIDQTGTGAVSMLNQGAFNDTTGSDNVYGNSYSFTFTNSGTVMASGGGTLTLGYYTGDTINNTGYGYIQRDRHRGELRLQPVELEQRRRDARGQRWRHAQRGQQQRELVGLRPRHDNRERGHRGHQRHLYDGGAGPEHGQRLRGGTLNITGTLDNTALVAPTGGAYTLGGGTISGGTVDGSLGRSPSAARTGRSPG